MSVTPIIDTVADAIENQCAGSDPRHRQAFVDAAHAALRAALPWDEPWPRSSAVNRLNELLRELYPEQFSHPERKITVTSTGYDPAIGRAVRDPTLE